MKPFIGLFIICLLMYYVFIYNNKKKQKNIEVKQSSSFNFSLWSIIKYLPLIFSYIMIPGW